MLSLYRIQRKSDRVLCTFKCDDCNPCAPGVILTGIPTIFVENLPIARVGGIANHCKGPCKCCISPNTCITGAKNGLVTGKPGPIRKKDLVARGIYTGGSIRTFWGDGVTGVLGN